MSAPADILQLGARTFVADRYVFTLEREYVNAWGQRCAQGRTFDLSTMTLQRGAIVTGPEYATTDDLVRAGFRLAGVIS